MIFVSTKETGEFFFSIRFITNKIKNSFTIHNIRSWGRNQGETATADGILKKKTYSRKKIEEREYNFINKRKKNFA